MANIYLLLAILSEVIATSALKASTGFTKLIPSIIVIIGYCCSFYFMSLTLKTIPLGVTYAIWSGLGIVIIATIGVVFYKESLDLQAILGMGLIIAGVIVIKVFSKTVG